MADHVLAEVGDPGVSAPGERQRCQFKQPAHRGTKLRNECDRLGFNDGMGPGDVVASVGSVPVADRLARIKDFAPLLVRADDFSGTRFPRGVSRDHFRGAIGVGDLELAGKNRAGSVLGESHPAEPPRIPAITNHGANGVPAGGEQPRDVVRLHHHALGVVRPAGVEDGIADAPAVDGHLVDPQRRGIQAGPGNRPAHLKVFLKITAGTDRVVGVDRPVGGVRPEQGRGRPG